MYEVLDHPGWRSDLLACNISKLNFKTLAKIEGGAQLSGIA